MDKVNRTSKMAPSTERRERRMPEEMEDEGTDRRRASQRRPEDIEHGKPMRGKATRGEDTGE